MAKTPRKHFVTNAWTVEEKEFSPQFSKVAESVFSLGNEYMGSRGFLDEGTSAPSLIGSYLNGVYEYALDKSATSYKGIATQTHYMVNAVNYFAMRIYVDDKLLDMATTPFENYHRTLDMKNGKLTRTLTWLVDDKKITTHFERFLDMEQCHRAYQRVVFEAEKDCRLHLIANVSFDQQHWGQPSRWQGIECDKDYIICQTQSTCQRVCCSVFDTFDGRRADEVYRNEKLLTHDFCVDLKGGQRHQFERMVAVAWGKDCHAVAQTELKQAVAEGYDNASCRNQAYWQNFWNKSDIEIVGDEENQQGIRFCIFQLQQTYHGANPSDNIGAKGLTGEAYSGHTFWDTETYCLPYYLFNNTTASKYLLEYRYNTLSQAMARARDLDCDGACYPIATLNGEEACTLWQHASLQIQPTTAVAYGIYHYVNVCKDWNFLYTHGAEMLVEICRFLATRGQWDSGKEHFGYYAVMGPDEFQMMVNHNTYTNYMAKKTFAFTLQTLSQMPKEQLETLQKNRNLQPSEWEYWQLCAEKMLILYDEKTQLFEQHDGFFRLPHINVDDIPDSQFPLYAHWSYDRIYRNDMIKQPDVLMFMLLYNGDFSLSCKEANYDYYEPRCIHESSLSPSVHSILACELGRLKEAYDFFAFATRMDLDDYNRNSCEGLHTTSISAAWLNIVYGFGGLRSDKQLSLAPVLPSMWQGYSFYLTIKGATIKVEVEEKIVTITNQSTNAVQLQVYGKEYSITGRIQIERC